MKLENFAQLQSQCEGCVVDTRVCEPLCVTAMLHLNRSSKLGNMRGGTRQFTRVKNVHGFNMSTSKTYFCSTL